MKLKWNVYRYSINRDKIEPFNIFEHYSFSEYVKHAMKLKDKDEFIGRLKSELMYYFWSKSEWELIVEITEDNRVFLAPWCGCREPDRVKIDVTDDTTIDWKGFAGVHIARQRYKTKAKVDVFDQVMFEWEKFVEYVWNEASYR